MKPPFVRSPYNYDTNAASDESGINTGTEGGAKQSFKDECDINVILKRFGIGYEIPQGLAMPTSGDFTGISDFHTAMNAVVQARETFDQLPAHIRAKFENDAGKFVDFTTNKENSEQLMEMGLLNQEATARIQKEREARQQLEDEQAAARVEARRKAAFKEGGGSPKAPSTDN